jgi:hypothetical protein
MMLPKVKHLPITENRYLGTERYLPGWHFLDNHSGHDWRRRRRFYHDNPSLSARRRSEN